MGRYSCAILSGFSVSMPLDTAASLGQPQCFPPRLGLSAPLPSWSASFPAPRSPWSGSVCEVLLKAGSGSGGRSRFVVVAIMATGGPVHVRCGPQLVSDLEVCPGCVSSLSWAMSEGNMLAVNRRWPAMSWTIILGESLARRDWTMRTV